MRFGASRRSLLPAALLLVLGLTLLGHVCVLPLHDHEQPATSHHAEDQDHRGGDSMHAASCEAVRSASPASPCVPHVTTALSADVAVPQTRRIPLTRRPQPSSSPPLYLLHAALLI
jgi:hypothetical protein